MIVHLLYCMTYIEGVREYCDVQLREVLQSWVDAMVPDPDPKKLMKMDPTYKKTNNG